MKKDVHCHEATFFNWKERASEGGVEGLNKSNSDILIKYISDMETGQNVGKGSKKGSRSYGRLNVLRQKLMRIFNLLEARGINDITKADKNYSAVHGLFDDLFKGRIKRLDNGQPYRYVSDYVRNFKAFWHWWMKINRKQGIAVEDITEDLSTENPAVQFVYLTKEQVDEMLPYFNEQQQVLIKFLYDTIIRFPTECLSLKVKDVYEKNGEVWLSIPDEISKNNKSGRTFNLLYCGDALRKYIRESNLQPCDDLFSLSYERFSEKLKKVAKQLWGDKISHPKAGEMYSNLSGYDFRHSGAIHLRILAQKNANISLDAVRQRGGWSDFKMLNYYTQFLGLTGEIKKEDLLISEDKSRLEKEIEQLRNESKQQKEENLKNKEILDSKMKELEKMDMFFKRAMENPKIVVKLKNVLEKNMQDKLFKQYKLTKKEQEEVLRNMKKWKPQTQT